ncbi:MAG: hypothetical protein ACRDQA_23640 [Nocardioidaceae bacterium]
MSRIRTKIGGAAGALALAAGSVGATALPAQADGSSDGGDPFPYRNGTVRAHGGLIAHASPSTHSPVTSTYHNGAKVKIDCKVDGPNIKGNDTWYLLPGEGPMWVSARYVENNGRAPGYCNPNDGYFTGHATARLNQRAGANVADAKVGQYAQGQRVHVGCWTESSSNHKWYFTNQGRWVSADYVAITDEVRYCSMHLAP